MDAQAVAKTPVAQTVKINVTLDANMVATILAKVNA
jgi:hypothetical protein